MHTQSLQLCLTLCDPMDYSPPGSSVHGILQARILEWPAMPSSRGASLPRDRTCVSCISCTADGFFTAEPPEKPHNFSQVQSLSRVRFFVTPWTAARQASLSITNSWSTPKTHVHWVGDAIRPSHSLSSPSRHDFDLSQHQGLFKWVSSSHQVAKVLEFQLQHQSFHLTLRIDLLWDGLVGSPCSPRDSQESSPIPQFKSINSSAPSFLYSPTLTSIHDYWKNHSFD